ncbi:MAG TPA: short-chain dehydrogenase [Vicinamibacteria bacterium]|nr:short-chain dehydrogenase [Vicinamibacteria bacterium]
MDISGKDVLILGGYGLVGQAVARRLLRESPRRMVLLSLRREEAEEAVRGLEPEAGDVRLEAAWGDVFTFSDLKDRPRREVLADGALRTRIIASLVDQLSEEAAAQYFLYQLVTGVRPDIIVDSVNTATGIAYQDIYQTSRRAFDVLQAPAGDTRDLRDSLELLLVGDYVPQLIRHVQVLYLAMVKAGTNAYVKIGTSGTGGMGLNIPYTHSEEKPSRVLLSKSALAGAHTLLLFLMARTPDGPITKEIKPAAAIAWKRIGYGEVLRGGRPVTLYDPAPALTLRPGQAFASHDEGIGRATGDTLHSVFIDTGENGIFSLEEFSAITTDEQMEFVTPEEIADVVARELMGGNTGHDVINALDNAVMGPTYRAGLMRHWALEKMRALEAEHGVRSVAFENLGPPRLSKLLHEANLLRTVFGTMDAVRRTAPAALSAALVSALESDPDRRLLREIVSIGIPVLLPDGRLRRGPDCKIPVPGGSPAARTVTPERVEAWAHAGWVDLREANMQRWADRFQRIRDEVERIPAADSSSRFLRDAQFWGAEGRIQPGKLVGWIFATEEKGARMK